MRTTKEIVLRLKELYISWAMFTYDSKLSRRKCANVCCVLVVCITFRYPSRFTSLAIKRHVVVLIYLKIAEFYLLI